MAGENLRDCPNVQQLVFPFVDASPLPIACHARVFRFWRRNEGSRVQLEGTKVGRWFVVKCLGRDKKLGGYVYLCRCECGTERIVRATHLRPKKSLGGRPPSQSCGCLARDFAKRTKHGLFVGRASPREFRCWRSMRRRCRENLFYIERKIKVCPEWDAPRGVGFGRFLKDMGRCPSPVHTIDRIDPRKGYEPGNCRWATPKEQAINTCTARMIQLDGQLLCSADWSKARGIPQNTIKRRLDRGPAPDEVLRQRRRKGFGVDGDQIDIDPVFQ